MSRARFEAVKSALTVPEAWRRYGLPNEAGVGLRRSPFPHEHKQGDLHPSFQVSADGTRWRNYATGEGGDVVDFVAKALRVGKGEALRRLEVDAVPGGGASGHEGARLRLAQGRGISLPGVRLAERRGLLRYGRCFDRPAWYVTDAGNTLREWRRLDGLPWPACGGAGERKVHTKGKGKDTPVGLPESAAYPVVLLVEGSADLVAAHDLIIREDRAADTACIAVLGGGTRRLSESAVAALRGKRVRCFPHADTTGRQAMQRWAGQLLSAGITVDAVNLAGLVRRDGQPGKDANDLLLADSDWRAANLPARLIPQAEVAHV